ncbi:Rep [uncultured virus]|uniref:Rep n=1 Tax=uncultured virus TaxID=340016 RepID=A0A2K9LS50_9VIRU|nr:Rep [uncultured virus]
MESCLPSVVQPTQSTLPLIVHPPSSNAVSECVVSQDPQSSSKMNSMESMRRGHQVEVSPPVLQKSKRDKQGRMSGTNWFLTFPRTECSRERALSQLQSAERISIKGCLIAQEQHQDGGHHLHIALWLNKRVSVPPSYFDFIVGKHGNYMRMKSGYATYNYLTKEDQTPISFGLLPIPGSKEAKEQSSHAKDVRKNSGGGAHTKSSLSTTITQAIQSGSSLKQVHDLAPGYFLREKKKIEEYITWWQSLQVNMKFVPWKTLSYVGTDVNTSLIVDWLNSNIKKSRAFKQEQLYVSGPPNARKTSLLLKLLEYLKAYEIPSENFYDLYPNPEPELLWMDEYKGAKTIQFLNMIAQGGPMTLPIKGAQRLKVANPPMIILSNLSIEQVYHKTQEKNPQLIQALQSRFLEIFLTDPIDLDNIVWNREATSPPALIVEENPMPQSPEISVSASVTQMQSPTHPSMPPPQVQAQQVDLRSASDQISLQSTNMMLEGPEDTIHATNVGVIQSLQDLSLTILDTGASASSQSDGLTTNDDELIVVERAVRDALEQEHYWATHRYEGEKKEESPKSTRKPKKPRKKLGKVNTLKF